MQEAASFVYGDCARVYLPTVQRILYLLLLGTLKPKVSFIVSLAHGLVVSGALILVLPPLFGGAALWWAVPLTEAAVAVYAIQSLLRPKDPASCGRK